MQTAARRWLFVLASACALATVLPAQAQWMWRDAQGRMQATQLPPPPGTPDTAIVKRPPGNGPQRGVAPAPVAASAAPAPAASATDPALEAKRKQAEQDEATKRKADDTRIAQARAENCERARAHMRSLDSGQRIARTNAQGEREIIDDRTRAQETEQTRRAIASDCAN